MPPPWPSSSALGLLFCKMRSMCWDVCNLLHAVFPPRGHTHPHKPRHMVTHSDTCWRPAPRAQPALGEAPVTHTLLPPSSHPHPGRSRRSRRAPPAGPRRRFCAPFPSPRRETAAGRAGMSSRRRPPGRLGLTRSRCRAAQQPGSAPADGSRSPPAGRCAGTQGGGASSSPRDGAGGWGPGAAGGPPWKEGLSLHGLSLRPRPPP